MSDHTDTTAARAMFETDLAAEHKIEVTFGKKRTRVQSIGCIQILESGTALHGGGDIKLYWCPNCDKAMQYSSKAPGQPFCEHCSKPCTSEEMVGERFFRCSIQDLAKMVEKIFHGLNSNADIYVKYHPTDLRRSTLEYTAEDQAVKLGQARAGRQRPVIYPMSNIIKDASSGKDISTCIKNFLEA
jgi:hypothetical protein